MGASGRARWVLLGTVCLAAGGCAGIDPERFVPLDAGPGGAPVFDGTVEVHAAVVPVSRGKLVLSGGERPAAILPALCRGKLDFLRGQGRDRHVAEPCRPFVAAREVDTFTPVPEELDTHRYALDGSRSRVSLFDAALLGQALGRATARRGLFRQVVPGGADLVLEVWLVDALRTIEYLGEGYAIDVAAVWRLTRVRDGAVLFADYASGHGGSHAVGTNAYAAALERAVQQMIGRGLARLAEHPGSLAALAAARAWPSLGAADPADHRATSASWPRLRKGLTVKEVRGLVPALPEEACSVRLRTDSTAPATTLALEGGRTLRIPNEPEAVYLGQPEVIPAPCGWILTGAAELEVYEPLYPFMSLTFVEGRLSSWTPAR